MYLSSSRSLIALRRANSLDFHRTRLANRQYEMSSQRLRLEIEQWQEEVADAMAEAQTVGGHVEPGPEDYQTGEDGEQLLAPLMLRMVDSREVYRGRWERMGKGGKAKGWVKRVVGMMGFGKK